MTTQEQKSIDNVYKLLSEIRTENQKFKDEIKSLVDNINTKTEKKLFPVTMEEDILKTAQLSIAEAIKTSLTGYSSPLIKLVLSVIDENSKELRSLINDSFTVVIRTEEFKASIVNAFSHKVARTIISNNDGLFDKVSNELKQDAIFKSKIALAVSNVVEECLKERNNKI